MKTDKKTKNAINGCKTARVFLWIGTGGSALTSFIGLCGAFVMGNVATLLTSAVAGGMAYLYGWMAMSLNYIISEIDTPKEEKNKEEEGEEDNIPS